MTDAEKLRLLSNHFNAGVGEPEVVRDLCRMADKADTWGGNFPIKNESFVKEEYIEDDRSDDFLAKLYKKMDDSMGVK